MQKVRLFVGWLISATYLPLIEKIRHHFAVLWSGYALRIFCTLPGFKTSSIRSAAAAWAA